MYSYNKLNRAVRMAMIVGAATAVAFPAAAQQSAEEKAGVERIAVTGSKIKRIGELSPTPVTVISGDTMVDAGITNVGELLSELPSAVAGLSPETTNGSVFASGLSQTSLRGLGSNRTLVLVNGRRFIGSNPGNTAVDLNNIPSAMIERIEVSTGGASAVYGSDAVAGVVNVITKKSFDGFEFDVATSRPQQDGGEEDFYSFTFGQSEGKSDFIANLTYVTQEQVSGAQRDFVRNGIVTIDNPINGTLGKPASADGVPGRVVYDRLGYSLIRMYDKTGTFSTGGKNYTFNPDGTVREFNQNGGFDYPSVANSSQNTRYHVGPNGAGDGYDLLEHTYLRTPLERMNMNLNWGYQINDNHRFSFESTYSSSKAFGESSPAFFGGATALSLDPTSPMLTQQARDFFASNKVTTPVSVSWLASSLGNRKYDQDRALGRFSLGLEGNLTEDWGYDAYVQKGHVQADTIWYGELLRDNLTAALQATKDAKGNLICTDAIARARGCVPLNVYGVGKADPAAIAFVTTDAMRKASLDQDVAGMSVNGDLFELPSGFISSAFSVEYRKEASSTLPDPAMRSGSIFNNKSQPLKGEYSVREASAEFSVPLINDMPFIQDLTLESAIRYMDYSSTGEENAWKMSFNYTVNDEIKFRLNRSKSVRAPNIGELYTPNSQTFRSLVDPCQKIRIESAGIYKDNVTKNCLADGIPAGWSPTSSWINGGSKPGFIQGNTDLVAERAYDITVGMIYTPEFLDGFSVTMDYWKFDIADQITSLTGPTVLNNCYRLESKDNQYCALITRDRDPNSANYLNVIDYIEKPFNSATSTLSGVDVETNYKFDLGNFGALDLRLMATYIEKSERNDTGLPTDQRSYEGEYGTFRWKGRFTANYTYEDIGVALSSSYLHDSVWDKNNWTPEVNNYNDIGSYMAWDLTSRYNVTDALQVRAGVLNLTDRQPVRNPNVYSSGEHYDILGRRFTLGLNYKF
jgi:outer membrane receptor protein involved in Fe transport